MAVDPFASPPVSARRHWLLRLFSSVWLGVALLAIIVVYSSVISALPPVRWSLELTDMSAFRHGFFVAVCALFVISLVVTTLTRSRWTAWNAGAVITHLGLIILIGGAVAYFGTKVEGDVLLQSPAILVQATSGGSPVTIARFRAAPNSSWSRVLPSLGARASATVQAMEADGLQPAARARVLVQVGDEAPQAVTLSASSTDWQPAAGGLELQLSAPPPQQYFYASEEPVLYLERSGQPAPIVKPLDGLPIHRERYLPEGEPLRDAQGHVVPSRRTTPTLGLGPLQIPTGWFETWRMPLPVDSADLPFSVRVTGYAPVVRSLQPRTLADGTVTEEPILEIRERRRADIAPRGMSAIRLEFTARDGSWRRSRWVLFSQYPDLEARALEFSPPGGGETWRIVYSRQRYPLGATLALRRAYVEYFPGQRGVESFYSDILVQPDGGAATPATVHTNQTFTLGRWTLFQSGFDGQEHWLYTILGVGNRVGMWPMNIGWVLVTLGCLYAFYVKPLVLRRLRNAPPRAPQSPLTKTARPQRTREYAH